MPTTFAEPARVSSAAMASSTAVGAPLVPTVSVTFAGTGPDQWIASAEGAEAANFAAKLRGRIGLFAAVSDQSDSRLVLKLSGPRVRGTLMKGVSIDLHPKAFKPGDVASTQVAYIGVQLDMLDDAPTYLLTGPRSMAGTLWSWLSASIRCGSAFSLC